MTKPKSPFGGVAQRHAAMHDARTELVKAQLANERAALDAKSAQLKALRLSKEAGDLAKPTIFPSEQR